MQIEPVTTSDLNSLTSLLKRNLTYEDINEALVREKVVDDQDFDPQKTLKVLIDGKLVGFMQGVARKFKDKRIGYIKLFATEKEYRRQGIASKLLEIIEGKLVEDNVSEIRILESVYNYLQPGLDPRYTEAYVFVKKRGYEEFEETSNLAVELVGRNFSTKEEEEKLRHQGVEIKRAAPEDKQKTLEFVDEFFDGWQTEVRTSFNNNPISLHIAKKDNKVIAFSAYDANNFNTGWFGPMGTRPDFRNLGLGGILLKRCLNDMKEQGHKRSIIPWVGPIVFYYDAVGAKVDRIFWRFRKEVRK